MATEWYFVYDGESEEHGPVSSSRLKDMTRNGDLGPDDLVWCEGMPEWSRARKVKGLFARPQTPPPAIPPAPEVSVRIVVPETNKVETIAKWTTIVWSTLCLFGICAGLANAGSSIEPAANEYEEAGAAVGIGCGMGIWLVVWAAIALPSVVIWLVSRKR